MGEFITWILENKMVILESWGLIVLVASVITKLIPGDADNKIVDAVLGFINKWLALNPTANSSTLRKK